MDLDDGGYASRKLWFGVTICATLAGLAIFAAFKVTLVPALEVISGSMVMVYAIYAGGNIAGKWVAGKAAEKPQA